MKYVKYLVLLTFIACSGIGLLKNKADYGEKFLAQVNQAKTFYKASDNTKALRVLESLKDEDLNADEKALKYNWIGIIYFSAQQFNSAETAFLKSLDFPTRDLVLASQINLNLASTYFKLDQHENAYVYVKNTSYQDLPEGEREKFTKLYFLVSFQLEKRFDIARSIILSKLHLKNLSDVATSSKVSLMSETYASLNNSERAALLDEFRGGNAAVIAYLALNEAKSLYYNGKKNEARDYISWLESNFSNPEILSEVGDFKEQISNVAKINAYNIGVILPLSGSKKSYGVKALEGIDSVLFKDQKGLKLFVKDEQESPVVARLAVKELIEKNSVSVIIGGLFADTAKEQYLEARKYGVMFISLSPIYLNKNEKNHLLVEVPGSVESQLNTLASSEFLKTMGSRVAIIYPESDRGTSYLDELWRRSLSADFKITAVASYPKDITDYRDAVSKLLGLYYKRERQEEFELWSEVWSKEKRIVRRIQTLPPVTDFDWVLAPSYPKEALQLLPVFSYFDAKGLKFVGGPSWRSKTILNHYQSLGRVHFVGDDQLSTDSKFYKEFSARYGKGPSLLETLGAESATLSLFMLARNYTSREEFESDLMQKAHLNGVFGKWSLSDGVWIKQMTPLRFSRNNIVKLQVDSDT